MGFLRFLHRLLLGVWIGALLCFGAVVAPALFRALGPALAGTVVRQVIPVLDVYALCAAPALIALGWVAEGRPARWGWLRTGALAAMGLFAALSLTVVTPRMEAIRRESGDRISELDRADPLRRRFGMLHGVSSSLMLGELLLGLAALAVPLAARRGAGEARPARQSPEG